MNNNYGMQVAMAVDATEDGEDELTLLFAGAPAAAVQRVMTFLCGGGQGIAQGFTVGEGHSPVERNGYMNDWLEVTLTGRNRRFASDDEVLLLVESAVAREVRGRVDRYQLRDFLNLSERNERRILSTAEHADDNPARRDDADERIMQEYPTVPVRLLAQRYGKSEAAIRKMAQRRGIKKNK